MRIPMVIVLEVGSLLLNELVRLDIVAESPSGTDEVLGPVDIRVSYDENDLVRRLVLRRSHRSRLANPGSTFCGLSQKGSSSRPTRSKSAERAAEAYLALNDLDAAVVNAAHAVRCNAGGRLCPVGVNPRKPPANTLNPGNAEPGHDQRDNRVDDHKPAIR